MQTVVKKWFRDKASGLLENGSGPNIIVRKIDLINCQFLKVGATRITTNATILVCREAVGNGNLERIAT